jgi:DNA-directed RNA polymerase specialized sigma24 family protein
VVTPTQLGFCQAHHSGVLKMNTTLTSRLKSQLAPGNRMNDTPLESGTSQCDRELQQLLLRIKNSPDRQQRVVRKQIDRLLREILDRLKPAQTALISEWSEIVDIESIVAEAVNNTLIETIKNIDRYDPDPPNTNMMKWINGILKYKFLDLLAKYQEHDRSVSIDDLDSMLELNIQSNITCDRAEVLELETASMASELRQFIEADPEGHLDLVHVRTKSDATFKAILLMRIDGLTWQEIADSLDISHYSTVHGFYNTQLRNWTHYFRKYL